ncbi:hypothetical protein J2X20_005810 [Pelomonas saccharophila]|uniref:THIF-type NAD/FAD binding fold domain-containing protein n=1 Tax=Roseateles saccharophilus TaxID=304 RepID=A0ABU1YXZ3_ROSSA|nr:hypothetical protein [Roseateles saccharophilus]MDR7273125.1 hypothetical protein [Roseateles saccharophilus]
MTKQLPIDLSRIDKLLLDRDAMAPQQSRALREASVPTVAVGDDCAVSEALQVALLTAVNLAHKSFSALVPVQASDGVWGAACMTALSAKSTLGEALREIGAVREVAGHGQALRLLIGDVQAEARALRVTFDGWRVGVGPAVSMARLEERPYCMLAPLAAAAVAVGESFSAWANISVEATRKNIAFSLWRPDLDFELEEALGEPVAEFPRKVEFFGLGHLGQAYVWAMVALPFEDKSALMPYLCDDDAVEPPNLETGALLRNEDLPGRKTRVVAEWLRQRGFDSRLVERFIDEGYRRCSSEPTVALSGFDNNEARQWLARAGFTAVFDSGLGGEATNFDSIAVRAWPHSQSADSLWPLENQAQREERAARQKRRTSSNPAYGDIVADECGKLLVADKAVAVPFVGAVAATLVLAEVLRRTNGGPVFSDCRLRVCSMSTDPLVARLGDLKAAPIRGLETVKLRC